MEYYCKKCGEVCIQKCGMVICQKCGYEVTKDKADKDNLLEALNDALNSNVGWHDKARAAIKKAEERQ